MLVLDYLRRSGRSTPATEMKALQYINLGYQRLLNFEVGGGGFDWYGKAPANLVLSAYGLVEFSDMAKVYEIDRRVIARTQKFIFSKQDKKDGTWSPEKRMPYSWRGVAGKYIVTSYVAWTVAESGYKGKELTKALLRAVAKVRKELAATKPKLGRGRPASPQARKAARQRQRIDQKVAELFEHRYLFVRHKLTRAQRARLGRMTRGHRELRILREIMDQVYDLFDRRCRSQCALEKLARLRRRVARFKSIGKTLKKLFSANLEKALTFLDDKLLPSTSNAVERGYRRHRKMQKTVYRVRTQMNISLRIALDMQREERAQPRQQITRTLHTARQRKAA